MLTFLYNALDAEQIQALQAESLKFLTVLSASFFLSVSDQSEIFG